MRLKVPIVLGLASCQVALAGVPDTFKPTPAPAPDGLLLKKGDRLAICGDSITEQKMYSRLIEDYLTACTPQLEIRVRQFGWGGERADRFLGRMKAQRYRVYWGDQSRVFTAEELNQGINLAAEFVENPFSTRFAMIDATVDGKQAFETREIKNLFRVPGDNVTMKQITEQTDKMVKDAERVRTALEEAIHIAYAPVTYTLTVVPE